MAHDEVLLVVPVWGRIEVVGVGGDALSLLRCVGHGGNGHMHSLFNSNK